MGKGFISSLRKLYFLLTPDKQNKLYSFNIIHPNFYVKTKMLIRSFFSSRTLMRKVHVYETLVGFIDDASRD